MMKPISLLLFLYNSFHIESLSAFPECKVSAKGLAYRGAINITKSGKPCQKWIDSLSIQSLVSCIHNTDDISNDHHKSHYTNEFQDLNPKSENEGRKDGGVIKEGAICWNKENLEENYCRNPDGRQDGPWCFVDSEASISETCDVPFCKPSASCLTTPLGEDFVGTLSSTRSGLPCQRWDQSHPHSNHYRDTDFPDNSITKASNHCRNPRGEKASPWCYTLDPLVQWQYCDLKLCLGCRSTTTGSDYAGTKATTKSGLPCRSWDTTGLTADTFPDKDVKSAKNYCRNPDQHQGGPWCYTTDDNASWESCDLPRCHDLQPENPVRHVLHIGIDGLNKCFVNASLRNIIPRLSESGSSTLKARTLIRTISAPCWTSILCSLTMESSGVLDNEWLPPWRGHRVNVTPKTGKKLPFPCLFDVLKRQDSNIQTAAFYDWGWIGHLTRAGLPWNQVHDQHCKSPKFMCDDIEYENHTWCDENITRGSGVYLKNILQSARSSYTFLYLGNLDTVGHIEGFCGEKYLTEVEVIDSYIGQLLDVIDSVGMHDEVLVVLGTDHGGKGKIHLNYEDSDVLVPLFFRGPGIKANHAIAGTARTFDIPPTILHAMGYQANPIWDGTVVYDIFK